MSTEQRPTARGGSGRIASLRARRRLEGDYERLRQTTLAALAGKLRAGGIHFDRADLDGFYNQAWHGLYSKLAAGDTVESPGGFLTQAAYFRAIDEYRKLHPDRRAEVEDAGDLAGVEVDVDAQLDDARRLREFLEGLKSRLDEREARAAALCYVHGYTRPEAAKILGVSPSRMEKLMDHVSKVVRALVADLGVGRWCDEQKSLMTAYAVNVLDPSGERHRLAVVHLRDCPGCRAYVRRLRGIAGVVPPALLPWSMLGLPAAHVAATAAGGGVLVGAPAGFGAAGSATAAASGSGGGSGGLGGLHLPSPPKTAVAVGAAVATAVVAAVAIAAVVRGGDDPAPRPTPRVAAAPAPAGSAGAGAGRAAGATSAAESDAAKARAARAERRREREARADRARRQRAAERDAAAEAARRDATTAATPPPAPTTTAAPPTAQDPAPTQTSTAPTAPTTTATTPVVPPSSPPDTSPPRSTTTAAEPPPEKPNTIETDAEQEFGLEP